MQSYTKVFILLSLLAASITLISFYHPEQGNLSNEVGDNLDCGFTDDFSTFLNKNGIFLSWPGFIVSYFNVVGFGKLVG